MNWLEALKRKLISKHYSQPERLEKLAATMVTPLQQARNYASVARRIFKVEQLPDPPMMNPYHDPPEETIFDVPLEFEVGEKKKRR